MTLYEFNQTGYTNLPKMAKSEINTMKERVTSWINDIDKAHQDEENVYFMLLNNESHYYTIFNWGESFGSEVADEIFSIVKDLGTLKSIEPTETGDAWEFWVTGQDAVTRMYLLFDYTKGVIEL